MRGRPLPGQQGAFVVEVALLLSLFLVLLIGIFEVGRTLYTLNVAAEATRRGARTAAVSAPGSALILASMQQVLPRLQEGQVLVRYLPAGCDPTTCQFVSVSVQNFSVQPIFIPLARVTVPPYTTTIPREGLGLS